MVSVWLPMTDIKLSFFAFIFTFLGEIGIKESLRKPELIRKTKQLGLIAGGTGMAMLQQSYASTHQSSLCEFKETVPSIKHVVKTMCE